MSYMTINRKMDKEYIVHKHNRTQLSLKNKFELFVGKADAP